MCVRFSHAGVSRRSVEVICRGWRHVHEVFSRRCVKEVSGVICRGWRHGHEVLSPRRVKEVSRGDFVEVGGI